MLLRKASLAFIALALTAGLASAAAPRVLFLTATGPHARTGKAFEHTTVHRAHGELSLAERKLIEAAGSEFQVEATQDPKTITPANLSKYQAIASYTCGDPLNDAGRRALIDFVRNGGAFIGIHSAGDSFNTYADYAEMLGGIHESHPGYLKVQMIVVDRTSPATAHLPETFQTLHEPYVFAHWQGSGVQLLLRMLPGSYPEKGTKNTSDYAVSWTKTFGRGKVFYTALGHSDAEWSDQEFLQHVLGGMRWALGTRGPVSAPLTSTSAAAPASVNLPPGAIQTEANQARIEVLKEQAPNAAEWALAPLDQSVPGDIRQNLTFLREDLLDEGKQKPKASPEAYALGSQLCNWLLQILEERTQTQARAGLRAVEAGARTGVSSQALDARRNYKMSWPQFQREEQQRAELKSQTVSQAAVLKERPKTEWVARTTVLRKAVDTLYAQYRDALRQAPAGR
jgi:type 1 glutamine amidotransferase